MKFADYFASGFPFALDKEFVAKYRDLPAPFGFGALGAVTFYRTYSLPKSPDYLFGDESTLDGSMESWVDVCERVINGMYSVQKVHAIIHGRPWSDNKGQHSAQEAFDRMFNFKWTPPGRGLAKLGSKFLHQRGVVESLQNCAFISTENIESEGMSIFYWFMENLMLGVGVGSDVRGANKVKIYTPNTENVMVWQIEDSREGWAQSVQALLESYTIPGSHAVEFDYSLIRPAGSPIKGFGGVASGPGPLQLLHERIRMYMERDRELSGVMTSRTLTDIFNAIGACVIAGNVRRCLPENANVQTDRGSVKIKDISIGDCVVTGGNSYLVTDKMYSGKQRVLKIKHRFGELECTENHSVAIFDSVGKYSFKLAKEIEIGDRLVFDGYGIAGNEVGLNALNVLHFNANGVKMPSTLDTDLAWFIGVVHGDGYVGPKTIEISQHIDYLEILERIVAIAKNKFGLNVKIEQHNKPKILRIRINSAELARWFATNIKTSKKTLHVPQIIKESSVECRGAYLAGLLDTDGRVTQEGVIEQVATIYPEFAKEIVSLLYTLGIGSTSRSAATSGYKENVVSYNVRVTGTTSRKRWIEIVGPHSTSDKILSIPPMGVHSPVDFTWPTWMVNEFTGKNVSNKENIKHSTVEKYGIKSKYFPTPVISVEYGDIEDTYDITVDDIHQFTTDGIVVHNSAEIMLGYPDDEVFIDIKNFEKYPDRTDVAWASNNSIIVENGFGNYDDIAERIYNNGEPGIIWMDNLRKYGRVGEIREDNAIGVNPCSEQALAHKEQCTLCELYPYHHDDIYDYLRTIKFAYLYGKTVTLLAEMISDETSREIMMKNRRIGLSNTGIAQFVAKHGYNTLRKWLESGYQEVQLYDRRYSAWLDVPESIKTTSVKPSGTISIVAGATPGVHYPWSKYYIRRINVADNSPLLPCLKDAGYVIETSVTGHNTMSVQFPVYVGEDIPAEDEVSMWEQLALVGMMQKHWSDNAVSATIKFKKSEVTPTEIARALDAYSVSLKAISMLPHFEDEVIYEQLPYEKITKEQYEEMMARIDESKLLPIMNGRAMMTDSNDSVDAWCDGQACLLLPRN